MSPESKVLESYCEGIEDQGGQSEDEIIQFKQRKIGKLQGLRLLEESKRAEGWLVPHWSLRIREMIAIGDNKICEDSERKFLEEDTSHLHI